MLNPVRYLTRVSMISMSLALMPSYQKYGPIQQKAPQLYKLDYSFLWTCTCIYWIGANPSADIESTGNILDAMKHCTTIGTSHFESGNMNRCARTVSHIQRISTSA